MGLIVPILLLATAAPAAQPARTTTRAAAISRAQDLEGLDAMERELNLTGDAAERFRAKANAERLTLSAWNETDSGRTFAALARERSEAHVSKDMARAKELWEQMRPLTAERAKLRRELRREVLATLSPEHLRQWAGYVLATRAQTELARFELTDDQRAQIRAMADVQAAPAADPEKVLNDPFLQSLHQLRPKLIDEAHQRVLTPQQIEKAKAKTRRVPGSTARPGQAAPVEREPLEKE